MTKTPLMVSAGAAFAFALAFASGSARADDCRLITANDVQAVTKTHVSPVPFMSKPGAGGKCANFAGDYGRLFLGVSRLESAADYANAVAAVPATVYPTRTKLAGVGDEAVLMKGGGGRLRYLLARKGGHGVILFPFGAQPSDEDLAKLANLALSR